MTCKKRDRQRRAPNFHIERGPREMMYLRQLAFHEVAHGAKADATRSLQKPGKQGEPSHLPENWRRRFEPQSGDRQPGYRRRTKIMDELNAAIENIFQFHARLQHRHIDAGLRTNWRMVLVDRVDTDFPVPFSQGPELETALELMGHSGFVAIDEEMHMIRLRRGFHFIIELVGVFCLDFRAVGRREDLGHLSPSQISSEIAFSESAWPY